MRRATKYVLLAAVISLGAIIPVTKQLWALWDLDLQGHKPPKQFIMTVTSPDFPMFPLEQRIPYGACTGLQNVPKGTYCSLVGCPPIGTWDFAVRADYGEEGVSASATTSCTITLQGGCACTQKKQQPKDEPITRPPREIAMPDEEDPKPPTLVAEPPTTDHLTTEPDQLDTPNDTTVDLKPEGEIPQFKKPPPRPKPWASQ